ncbi:MAG: MBL fold metallo-hydrolase [Bryobacteraceae bacterium]
MSPLIERIDAAEAREPTLWYLGRRGFVLKHLSILFYLDPVLPAPLEAEDVWNADMILRTQAADDTDDPTATILPSSGHAKVLMPKSASDSFEAAGVALDRMTTTDADLRVEYFKNGQYARIYSVPSAREGFDYTPLGGYPYLGYLIRFGRCTIYHPGAAKPYEGLADRLKPYNVTVALIPVGDGEFEAAEAAELAEAIRAEWLVPMNASAEQLNHFVDHMLGHRPAQKFKILEVGEEWPVPHGQIS